MKKKLAVLFVALALALVGCGKSVKTLEDYVTDKDVQKQIVTAKSKMTDTYSDLSLTSEGNTLIYTYTYNDDFDVESVDVDSMDETASASTSSSIEQIEKQTGLDDLSIRYVFQSSDGTVVFDRTYP